MPSGQAPTDIMGYLCRCAVLLKLGKPRDALMDANAVLHAADNVKAHFRAGQAHIALKVGGIPVQCRLLEPSLQS